MEKVQWNSNNKKKSGLEQSKNEKCSTVPQSDLKRGLTPGTGNMLLSNAHSITIRRGVVGTHRLDYIKQLHNLDDYEVQLYQ